MITELFYSHYSYIQEVSSFCYKNFQVFWIQINLKMAFQARKVSEVFEKRVPAAPRNESE